MDRAKFFNSLRPHVNLTTQNVFGIGKVLDYGSARGTETNDLAYILATAWWETAQTMTPVIEAYWQSEDWRRKNLRYYPWYGRGLVQTTWRENYEKMSRYVGVDLIVNPSALLQWKYALPALFIGMEKGLYTGYSLSDFIDDIDESDAEDYREYVNARRVVNATDKASTIAKLALHFERALRTASYRPGEPGYWPEPTDPSEGNWLTRLITAIITAIFGPRIPRDPQEPPDPDDRVVHR